jgi:hypothetical protein
MPPQDYSRLDGHRYTLTVKQPMKVPKDVFDSFIKAEKPAWVKPNDFAVMTTLLHASLENPGLWLSAQTIAERSCVCERSTFYSLKKLKKKEWIRWDSGKRRQKSNTYEILEHNLPTYIPRPKLVVSEKALMLAKWYRDTFANYCMRYVNGKGRKCTRRIPKDWSKRWSVVLQKRLDLTDFNTVAQQLNRSAEDFLQGRSDRFVRGPQCLPWPKPERKENNTTVHIADTTNEPGATPASGSSKPLVEAPPEGAQISEVSTTESLS